MHISLLQGTIGKVRLLKKNMEVQQIIVLILFLAAAGFMGWRVWKTFDKRNAGGCAKGCGCATEKATSIKA